MDTSRHEQEASIRGFSGSVSLLPPKGRTEVPPDRDTHGRRVELGVRAQYDGLGSGLKSLLTRLLVCEVAPMRSLGKNLVCISVLVALTSIPIGPAEAPQTRFQKLPTLVAPRRAVTQQQSSGTRGDIRPLRLVLAQTDGALRESARRIQLAGTALEELALLDGLRAQLTQLDTQFESYFQDIEAKLRRAGLSSKVPALDAFRQHYRSRMASLRLPASPCRPVESHCNTSSAGSLGDRRITRRRQPTRRLSGAHLALSRILTQLFVFTTIHA